MMETARTSETSVDIQLTRQYIPEDSELHTRRRENLRSHIIYQKTYHLHTRRHENLKSHKIIEARSSNASQAASAVHVYKLKNLKLISFSWRRFVHAG
jgi:hypothetical protein